MGRVVEFPLIPHPLPPSFCDPAPLSPPTCSAPPSETASEFKYNPALGKGQISNSTGPWASSTKATEFTSFNSALAFVLVEQSA